VESGGIKVGELVVGVVPLEQAQTVITRLNTVSKLSMAVIGCFRIGFTPLHKCHEQPYLGAENIPLTYHLLDCHRMRYHGPEKITLLVPLLLGNRVLSVALVIGSARYDSHAAE
jgi:hypothetical protein